LSGVALGTLLQADQPGIVAVVGAVVVGVTSGLLNGLLVSFGRLPPFIATLGMMSVARGSALVLTEGRPISGFSEGFRWVATGSIGPIPAPVVVTLLVYALAHIAITRTTFGRYVYAAGGNPEAARLSGVRVDAVRAATFAISGALAGVAGVMAASRVATGQADAGVGLELTAIAAVVIGGTSILGGEGAIWRTVCGVLLLAMLGNGLTLLGVQTEYQQMIQGGIILAAVGVDAWARRQSAAET
jgi:ribose transport system permease protein